MKKSVDVEEIDHGKDIQVPLRKDLWKECHNLHRKCFLVLITLLCNGKDPNTSMNT